MRSNGPENGPNIDPSQPEPTKMPNMDPAWTKPDRTWNQHGRGPTWIQHGPNGIHLLWAPHGPTQLGAPHTSPKQIRRFGVQPGPAGGMWELWNATNIIIQGRIVEIRGTTCPPRGDLGDLACRLNPQDEMYEGKSRGTKSDYQKAYVENFSVAPKYISLRCSSPNC